MGSQCGCGGRLKETIIRAGLYQGSKPDLAPTFRELPPTSVPALAQGWGVERSEHLWDVGAEEGLW